MNKTIKNKEQPPKIGTVPTPKKGSFKIISISISSELLEKIYDLIRAGVYQDRTEVVRTYILRGVQKDIISRPKYVEESTPSQYAKVNATITISTILLELIQKLTDCGSYASRSDAICKYIERYIDKDLSFILSNPAKQILSKIRRKKEIKIYEEKYDKSSSVSEHSYCEDISYLTTKLNKNSKVAKTDEISMDKSEKKREESKPITTLTNKNEKKIKIVGTEEVLTIPVQTITN